MVEWLVPELWPQETVFILGGGPSLVDVDLTRIPKGARVIAVNDAFRLYPKADICFFLDCAWYDWNHEEVADFQGLLVTCCDRYKNRPELLYLRRGRKTLEDRRNHLAIGGNSGHCAINLAAHLGGNLLILLGFDMKTVEGKHNWHTHHQRTVPDNIYEAEYFKGFEKIKPGLAERNITVLNATPGSALTSFPIIDPEEVLANVA